MINLFRFLLIQKMYCMHYIEPHTLIRNQLYRISLSPSRNFDEDMNYSKKKTNKINKIQIDHIRTYFLLLLLLEFLNQKSRHRFLFIYV